VIIARIWSLTGDENVDYEIEEVIESVIK